MKRNDEQQGHHEALEIDKQREKFSIEIRKQHRQDILSKRRNQPIPQASITSPMAPQQPPLSQFQQQLLNFSKKTYIGDDYLHLLTKFSSADPLLVHQGLIGIRKLVSIPQNRTIQDVIDSNLVPKLIQFAYQNQYPRLQVEAAWVLTNIASGDHSHCKVVVQRGGIELFRALIDNANPQIVDHAVWAVGNIASDCVENRDALLKLGVLPRVIQIYEASTSRTGMFLAAWVMCNLCRGTPSPKPDLIKAATPYICRVIADPDVDHELLTDCCWALYHLCMGKNNVETIVKSPGVCEKLTMLLEVPDGKIVNPTVRVVGTILSCDAKISKYLTQYDILRPLQKLTHNIRTVIRKQACWSISNYAGQCDNDISTLLTHQSLINRLLQLLLTDQPDIQYEILWVFLNISTFEQPKTLAFLQSKNVLKFVVSLMSNATNDRVLEVALKTIKAMLRLSKNLGGGEMRRELVALGGVKLIEHLQQNQSDNVYNMSVALLEEFFETENPLERG